MARVTSSVRATSNMPWKGSMRRLISRPARQSRSSRKTRNMRSGRITGSKASRSSQYTLKKRLFFLATQYRSSISTAKMPVTT